MSEKKTYTVYIPFQTLSFTVKAEGKLEARKKAYEKINKKPASEYVDFKNMGVDES